MILPNEPAPSASGRRLAVGWFCLLGALGYAVLLFYGMGPKPDIFDLPWYAPRSFLYDSLTGPLEVLSESWVLGVPILTAPAILFTIGVFLCLRRAVAGAAALVAVVASAQFIYWGTGNAIAWSFFHWRWSGSMVLASVALGVALGAPWLARSWLRLPGWGARAALFLPIALLVVGCMRDVTGTDEGLFLALSPWPYYAWFAMELGGTLLAAIGSLVALVMLSSAASRIGVKLAGLLSVGGFVVAVYYSKIGLGPDLTLLSLCLAALVIVLCLGEWDLDRPLERAALYTGVGALGILLPVYTGIVIIERDYVVSRDFRAVSITTALAEHLEAEGEYPDDLELLVEGGKLDSVPITRVGFQGGSEFVYHNFGTSYLLEFSAQRWAQCAYSSPYADEEEYEDEELDDEDHLEGSWTCPSKPPDLFDRREEAEG